MKNKMVLVKKHEDSSNLEQDGAMTFPKVQNQNPAPQPNKP